MGSNTQVTDSLTQVSLLASGQSPSTAMASLQLSTNQALALKAHDATLTQQQGQALLQATTVEGVNILCAAGASFTARLMKYSRRQNKQKQHCISCK